MVIKQELEAEVSRISAQTHSAIGRAGRVERGRTVPHTLHETQLGDRPGHQGIFDTIDHRLMMRAVKRFTQKKHILLYVERWLKAPVMKADGALRRSRERNAAGRCDKPLLATYFCTSLSMRGLRKNIRDEVREIRMIS